MRNSNIQTRSNLSLILKEDNLSKKKNSSDTSIYRGLLSVEWIKSEPALKITTGKRSLTVVTGFVTGEKLRWTVTMTANT